MLQPNKLRARLAAGQRVYGLINSIPSPLLVEMIGYAGFDFVILDLEHVGVNPQTLEDLIRAAECCGLTPMVRVPGVEPGTILRVLDAGAQGIVVPRVQDEGQARQAVRASRYHPSASAASAAAAHCWVDGCGVPFITGGRRTLFSYVDRAGRSRQRNATACCAQPN